MDAIPILTVEDVKQFAAMLEKTCKERMRRRGDIPRLCYAFVAGDRIPEFHEATGIRVLDRNMQPVNRDAAKGTACQIVAIDLNGGPRELVGMLAETYPRFRQLLPAIEQLGRETGVAEAARPQHIVNAWKTTSGLREAQIVTDYLRALVKRLEPYAIVHQADTWWAETTDDPADRAKLAKDLEQEPTAREAISITIEAQRYSEAVSIPYTRTPPKTGKVTSFDEPKRIINGTGGAEIKGRMFGMLRDIPLN